MATEVSNSAVQTIPVGGSVTFDVTIFPQGGFAKCPCAGSSYHRQGSSAITLRGKGCPALFEVHFNGNITSADAATAVQLAIAVNGSALPETLMQQTIATANAYANVSAHTFVGVCPGETLSLTVVNNGANPVIVNADSAFTVSPLK